MNKHMIIEKIKNDIKNCAPAVLLIALTFGAMYFFYGTFCIFRMFMGFPCPGCGLTSAALCLLCGNPTLAWQYNPAIFAWIPFILYFLISRYFIPKAGKYIMLVTVIVCIITIFCFVYRLVKIYPGPEPMNYHSHNIVMQLLERGGEKNFIEK